MPIPTHTLTSRNHRQPQSQQPVERGQSVRQVVPPACALNHALSALVGRAQYDLDTCWCFLLVDAQALKDCKKAGMDRRDNRVQLDRRIYDSCMELQITIGWM